MPPEVIIDTDVLSYYLKGYPDVVQELDEHEKEHGSVFISRITVVEILGGLKALRDKLLLYFFLLLTWESQNQKREVF